MPNDVRKFVKGGSENERQRLHFTGILHHCPDLGNRVIMIRSRVKNLKGNFEKDAKYALIAFNVVTIFTILIAIIGVFIGVKTAGDKLEFPSVAVTSAMLATLVGITGAASNAFAWHKRYYAMFQARWVMVSLELQIDDLVFDFAYRVKPKEPLSEDDLVLLRTSKDAWLKKIDETLKEFGNSYGGARSVIDLKTKLMQLPPRSH